MQPADILHFWFDEIAPEKWFIKDLSFDEMLKNRFLETYESAVQGNLNEWRKTPEGALALVIVLDQFSRNMFRDTPQAYATDTLALEIAKEAIRKGFDKEIIEKQRHFLYMPFMHAESLKAQEEGVKIFSQLGNENALDYMIQHHNIIQRFGRFPHRNKILARDSTIEEVEFLEQPNSSF